MFQNCIYHYELINYLQCREMALIIIRLNGYLLQEFSKLRILYFSTTNTIIIYSHDRFKLHQSFSTLRVYTWFLLVIETQKTTRLSRSSKRRHNATTIFFFNSRNRVKFAHHFLKLPNLLVPKSVPLFRHPSKFMEQTPSGIRKPHGH